jgi:hypothetical protein
MFRWRKLISIISGVLLFTAIVHADMVPIFKPDTELQTSACDLYQTKEKQTDLSYMNDSPLAVSFNLVSIQFPLNTVSNIEQVATVPHSIDLTNEQGSVSLCLYTMLGLGLCNAPHWFKRLYFIRVPECYRNGGPFQIDHSLTVSSKSLCSAKVCCFIQSVRAAEHLLMQYHFRVVVFSWWKSQFTSVVLAPRGPPEIS